MLLTIKGIPVNIHDPLVGRITRDPGKMEEDSFLICESEIPKFSEKEIKGILTNFEITEPLNNLPMVTNVATFEHLSEGDIVVVKKDGNIKTLYRVNSLHNIL